MNTSYNVLVVEIEIHPLLLSIPLAGINFGLRRDGGHFEQFVTYEEKIPTRSGSKVM